MEMRLKFDSRGRKLKFEQWPDLAKTLDWIFDNQDVTERAGQGVEAHPRLKNEVLYRSKDRIPIKPSSTNVIGEAAQVAKP